MTKPLIELSLEELVPHAWALLDRAAETGMGSLQAPVLATVGPDGLPQARVVGLRSADPEARQLRFFTDARSPKAEALRGFPHAALCFYDPNTQLQLRATGWVELHHKADGLTRSAWDGTGLYSRRNYLTTLPPGSPLEAAGDGLPEEYDPQAASGEHLMVVSLTVERMDWLLLSHEGHRRAEAFAPDGKPWTTRWLVP